MVMGLRTLVGIFEEKPTTPRCLAVILEGPRAVVPGDTTLYVWSDEDRARCPRCGRRSRRYAGAVIAAPYWCLLESGQTAAGA